MKIKTLQIIRTALLFCICFSILSCTSIDKPSTCKYSPLTNLTYGNLEELQLFFNARACMDTSKITFKIDWSDDIINSIYIPESERRWKDPTGQVRDKDKMYFYDNLGIRLFAGENFYEGWLMPVANGLEYQWQNQGSMKTRTSTSSSALLLETSINQDSSFAIKASLQFEDISFNVSDTSLVKAVLIIVDADIPEIHEMNDRLTFKNYFVLEEELRIHKENN